MDRHTVKEDGKYIQEYATFRTIRSEGGLDCGQKGPQLHKDDNNNV